MSSRMQTFNVPLEKMGDLRALLLVRGIKLTEDDSGSVAGPHGFSVTWSYAAPSLCITLDGPAFLMSLAFGRVANLIQPFTV